MTSSVTTETSHLEIGSFRGNGFIGQCLCGFLFLCSWCVSGLVSLLFVCVGYFVLRGDASFSVSRCR